MKKKRGEKMNGWLYGWKEIAEFVGCDMKTVQKYVIETKFPIHRFPGKNKIFAIPSEIDRWGLKCKKV